MQFLQQGKKKNIFILKTTTYPGQSMDVKRTFNFHWIPPKASKKKKKIPLIQLFIHPVQ